MQEPTLHQLLSVASTVEANVYLARVDITDMEGNRYEADYVSVPGDTVGLAPVIRDEITDWIAAGNTPAPYVAPPPEIPDRVTARQFKLQLLSQGLLDQVEAWIASQSQDVQIAYANSGTFLRTEPMMQQGFTALSFTEQQVDDFFIAAAKL